MWGSSINRPRIPVKMSARSSRLPLLSPNLHSSVPTQGNGCLLTRALARHYDKHSLWLPVPPKCSKSSSLPSSPPIVLGSLSQRLEIVSQLPRVWSSSVSSHQAVSPSQPARHHSTSRAASPVILRHHPLPIRLNHCPLLCTVTMFKQQRDTMSAVRRFLHLLSVILVIQFTWWLIFNILLIWSFSTSFPQRASVGTTVLTVLSPLSLSVFGFSLHLLLLVFAIHQMHICSAHFSICHHGVHHPSVLSFPLPSFLSALPLFPFHRIVSHS